jgi:glycosyltransferase involved in cell wall biosynthesis
MGGAPLVSFLVPVRDEAEHLEAALSSLSAQTYEGFEAIVVDDGSTDGSGALARRHARGDGRFRVLRQPPLGIVAALERARAEARGRHLARMDGDDVSHPRRLELQLAALEAEGLDAVGGGVRYVSDGRVTDGLRRYEEWLNGLVTVEAAAADVLVECPLPHPTLLARADAVEAVGGWVERGWPEDYDLVLRLWRAGARFRNVAEVVLDWRDHGGRLSRTDGRYGADAFLRCKVEHLASVLAGREAVVWGAGPVGKALACELLRRVLPLRAFVEVDPRKLGKRIYGVPVVTAAEGAGLDGTVALGAVAGAEARAQLRKLAREEGRVEGEDFFALA